MNDPFALTLAHPPSLALPALALGPAQTGRLLAALLSGLARGGCCYCLDGGNCFNPYTLSTEARRRGLDPTPLLERLFVSRAYTCHQLLEAVVTMLAPLAERPAPPPVFLLGLDRLFLDDDLPLAERRRIFARLVARAAGLARRGLPLLVTLNHAEWGMRQAELKGFYEPFQILSSLPGVLPPGFNPPSAIDEPQWECLESTSAR